MEEAAEEKDNLSLIFRFSDEVDNVYNLLYDLYSPMARISTEIVKKKPDNFYSVKKLQIWIFLEYLEYLPIVPIALFNFF